MSDIYVASISGGKDSVAMCLLLAKEGYNGYTVDEYIFADTGKEFPECYEALEMFEQITGKTITRLKNEKPFEYYLAEAPTTMNRKVGYGFPTMWTRWCTSYLKRDLIAKYLKGKDAIQLIGIAADETKRIKPHKQKRYPLVEWGMTEAECLSYCQARGIYQGNSPYNHINRMSCYCCPLTNNRQVEYLIRHRPELWADIKHMEKLCGEPWKRDRGTDFYEKKFSNKEAK